MDNNQIEKDRNYQASIELFNIMNRSRYSEFSGIAKRIDRSDDTLYPKLETCIKPLKKFVTGSSYSGQWDHLGMSGFGVYTLPNNVTYRGKLQDGRFHGFGILYYSNGCQILGNWSKGHLIRWQYVLKDGNVHSTTDNILLNPSKYFE